MGRFLGVLQGGEVCRRVFSIAVNGATGPNCELRGCCCV
jgi:hypothetical protein